MLAMNTHENQCHCFVTITMRLKKYTTLSVTLLTLLIFITTQCWILNNIIIH